MTTKFVKEYKNENIALEEYKSVMRDLSITNAFKAGYKVAVNQFKEVPDREEQLADMLQEAVNLIDELPYDEKLQETRGNFCMNAQATIFRIKNNAPKLLDDE